jgi:rod shape-determining protein MreB
MSVQGRDLLTGKPKVEVSYREIAKALDKSIQRIEDAVMETLSQTPPELAADIYNTGIYLAGGGSMLRGLDKRISQKTYLFTLQKILYEQFEEQVWRLKPFEI